MKPASFEYHRPTSVGEAAQLLVGLDGEARPIAGGQSLVPLMNLRLAQPDHLIDLNDIDELTRIAVDGDALVTGAMVRQHRLIDDPLVAERLPLLAEAAQWIGHTAIRYRGTVGGSLAHADPAAELPALALVLDAEFRVVGPRGGRTIPAREFFAGHFTTTLEPDELLVDIRWPAAGAAWGFRELARRHGDFATVLAAVSRRPDHRWRIVIGSIGPVPVRADRAEELLGTAEPTDRMIDDAAAIVCEGRQLRSDVHATGAYRLAMATAMASRALRDARERVR